MQIESAQSRHSDCFLHLGNPFTRVDEITCDLILAPSHGTFLNNFTRGTGLHIAVVDSQSRVLEFDHEGIRCHHVTSSEIRWHQCLRLNIKDHLLSTHEAKINLLWDQTCELLLGEERANWSDIKYEPENLNCFDFALAFLAKFVEKLDCTHSTDPKLAIFKEKLSDRVSFCEHLILPQTKKAAMYISLYRRKEYIGSELSNK